MTIIEHKITDITDGSVVWVKSLQGKLFGLK